MTIDTSIFHQLVTEKLISVQKHPTENLWIYNYTQKAQFRGMWTPELLMCRGLIVDDKGNVIARPFDKFFNLDEHEKSDNLTNIPNVPFTAFDKFDGSLGISYPLSTGGYALATRGSFTSEQAIKGTQLLQDWLKNHSFAANETYLFEIIYPGNRIVVDYGKESKIELLATRNIETGKVTPLANKISDYLTPRDNSEGVVLYFDNGFMCKVKYEEYVRLHRLVTGVNARKIWECLKSGIGTKDMLERVPEEFADWVRATTKDLQQQFDTICHLVRSDYVNVMKYVEVPSPFAKEESEEITYQEFLQISKAFQKDINDRFLKCTYPALLHAIHSKMQRQDFVELVWGSIKPPHETPFKEDEL